jgi:PAS domain S-box-containing protein
MTQWAIIAYTLVILLLVLYILRMQGKIRRKDLELGTHAHRFAASEKRVRTIINAIPDMFFILDRDGTYLEYSTHDPDLLKAFEGRLKGQNLRDFFPRAEADRLLGAVRDALAAKERVEVEYELDVIAGRREFTCLIVPLERDTVVWFARDITLQKEREALVRKSLDEKETLVREIHHRVKNNLQVISSLISLQEAQFQSEHDRKLLHDTMHRIQSMSHLHELLYQSESLASINVGTYLADVIDDLLFAFLSETGNISVSKDLEPLIVCLDAALPLGLIVNEIVMISLRFLHPAGSSGSLSVSLRSEGERVVLTVLNEGPGLKDFSVRDESASLGFILVPELVRQLSGTVTQISGKPGNVRCEFPLAALRVSRGE